MQQGIKGLFTSGLFGNDAIVNDLPNEVLITYPGLANTLFAMSARMKQGSVSGNQFSWQDSAVDIPIVHASAQVAADGTTLTLAGANANTLCKMMMIMNATTKEYFYVTNQSGATLTVKRGMCGSTAGVIATTDDLYVLYQVSPEASSRPPSRYYKPAHHTNYVQIIRTLTEVSKTSLKTNYRGVKPSEYIKKMAYQDHVMQCELAMMFGRKGVATVVDADGVEKPMYMTDGIYNQIKTNRTAFTDSNPVTLKSFITAVNQAFGRSVDGMAGNTKLAFTSRLVLEKISALMLDNKTYIMKAGETEYGIKVNKIICPSGEINLIADAAFDALPAYQGSMVVMDPNLFEAKYNDKTVAEDASEPGKDSVATVMTSRLGVKVQCEECNAVIDGLLFNG